MGFKSKLLIKLVRSNLPRAKGMWFARAATNKVLGIDDVVKTQGLSTVNYNAMTANVKQYFDAMAQLLCEGFVIDTGYFTISPTVKGGFKTNHDAFDRKRHSVTFQFQIRPPLLRLARLIKVSVARVESQKGGITRFVDTDSDTTNKRLTPKGLFIVEGYRIKIAGDKPDSGMWFVSAADSRRYRVTKKLLRNTAGEVMSIAPALPAGDYTIEIKTQYKTGGGTLKEPRTITSGFTLRVG